MTKSMTGFGMGESAEDGISSRVEMKTVNNRYLDIKVKMPLQSLDILQRIENMVQRRINRGTVQILIKVDGGNEDHSRIRLNEELLSSYLQSLNRLKEITGLSEDINLDALLRYKEIFEFIRNDEDEHYWKSIQVSLENALDSLTRSRETEGNKLMEDILKRVDRMKVTVNEIEQQKNDCLKEFKEKLEQKIHQIGQDISLNEGRIEMEVSILAQKSDISEEIKRLKCHLNQLKKIAKNSSPIGRKIEFYTQEVGREINTLGAKLNHSKISSKVIRLKSELEKIKEQSRNIE